MVVVPRALVLASLAFAALPALAVEEAPATPAVTKVAEKKPKILPVTLDYGIRNVFGVSNFLGRPHLIQSASLGVAYDIGEVASVSLGLSGNAEFFTGTGHNTEYALMEDPGIDVSTSALPPIEVGDWKLSISPSFAVSLPLSAASRLVTPNYGSYALSFPLAVKWKDLGIALSGTASYTPYTTTHFRYVNKASDDHSDEGDLLAPWSISLGASASYSLGILKARTGYTLSKSKSYENNAGNAYWSDSAKFSLGLSAALHDLLNVGLSYSHGSDPLDPLGRVRNPFFSDFADWYNRGRFTLSLSGSYS